MGRGRAKAKQVKVARQLKYSGGGMDLDQLRAEFGVGTGRRDGDDHAAYADLANRYSVNDKGDDGDGEDEDDLDYDEDDPDDEDFDDEDDLDDEDFEDEDFDEDDEDEDEDDPADAERMSRAAGS